MIEIYDHFVYVSPKNFYHLSACEHFQLLRYKRKVLYAGHLFSHSLGNQMGNKDQFLVSQRL